LVWVWKISPNNPKKNSIWVKKISSGQVKKYLGQRQVGFLFTLDQKYAWVGSGQGLSLIQSLNLFPCQVLVMGPGQKFLTQVSSGQCFIARVGSGQPYLVWVWKIFIQSITKCAFHCVPKTLKKDSFGFSVSFSQHFMILCCFCS